MLFYDYRFAADPEQGRGVHRQKGSRDPPLYVGFAGRALGVPPPFEGPAGAQRVARQDRDAARDSSLGLSAAVQSLIDRQGTISGSPS